MAFVATLRSVAVSAGAAFVPSAAAVVARSNVMAATTSSLSSSRRAAFGLIGSKVPSVSTRTRQQYSTTTRLHANVLKLNDPQSQLLDQVDVFIFDCDGVIWRVRT